MVGAGGLRARRIMPLQARQPLHLSPVPRRGRRHRLVPSREGWRIVTAQRRHMRRASYRETDTHQPARAIGRGARNVQAAAAAPPGWLSATVATVRAADGCDDAFENNAITSVVLRDPVVGEARITRGIEEPSQVLTAGRAVLRVVTRGGARPAPRPASFPSDQVANLSVTMYTCRDYSADIRFFAQAPVPANTCVPHGEASGTVIERMCQRGEQPCTLPPCARSISG